jgi:DNA invertase Pin-like site-specific DNA recombinase
MADWWLPPKKQDLKNAKAFRAVAYYRHSAQDRQENSVPLQREHVQKWAAEHGITVIKEFADHGKSGLSTEHRDAFNDMIENWVKKRDDFEFVLVLDVSRWGRFQDTDVSAVWSAQCKDHGKQVVYTTFGIPKKDDPIYPVYVMFERCRAAQYSQYLSVMVYNGCAKVAQQGFRPGSGPPYGLSRLLLDEARKPVQILKRGERKSIQNQRVTLAPGEDRQVAVVRRIFQEFIDGAKEEKIAGALNRDNITSPKGKQWDVGKIRRILRNEAYTGTIIYNKTKSRLTDPCQLNPPEQWIRTPGAFKGIISRAVFEQARKVFEARARIFSRENMLERLKSHYETYGFIKESLIRADPKAPAVGAYVRAFGSVDLAFVAMFEDVVARVREAVKEQLRAKGASILQCEDFLVINKSLTVLVQPSVPVEYACRNYWAFRADPRPEIDITLAVPLSNSGRYDILGYLALPRVLVRNRVVRLTGPADAKIEMFGHHGLELIQELTA